MEGAGTSAVEEGRQAVRAGGASSSGGQAAFDDVRAAPAVVSFLRDTRIGRIVP